MAPLPKHKYAKARRGLRRSHLGIEAKQLVECSQCHAPKLPHHACTVCGTYNGREIIKIEKPKEKKS